MDWLDRQPEWAAKELRLAVRAEHPDGARV